MLTFRTVDALLAHCETAGLEPRTQHGTLGETSYWVCINGSYIASWSDDSFLSWGNAFFNLPSDDDDTLDNDDQ